MYLYRDYAFESPTKPTKTELLQLFRSDFGFVGKKGEQDFAQLFESTDSSSGDLFEETH
jgi:hypothetical protein